MATDGIFDGICPKPDPITDVEAALRQRQAARKAVAGFASDAEDLRYLLTVLALWPSDDSEALAVRNKSLFSRTAGLTKGHR